MIAIKQVSSSCCYCFCNVLDLLWGWFNKMLLNAIPTRRRQWFRVTCSAFFALDSQ